MLAKFTKVESDVQAYGKWHFSEFENSWKFSSHLERPDSSWHIFEPFRP